MFYYTYILRNKKDKKWYTGSARDLRKRFKEHLKNNVASTKGRGPFELIYYEACLNEQDARQREKYLKSGMGKRYLKNRLKRFLFLTGLILGLMIFLTPSLALANVVINEIAWMGSNNGGTATENANDEWIELYNNGTEDTNLNSWSLVAADGTPLINLSGTIKTNNFFLLERSDDNSVPNVLADMFYTGALSNDGEKLILKDAGGSTIDTIDASGGWPEGDNTTKKTMQWNGSRWITATATPKAMNASVSAPSEPPPQQQQSQTQSSGGGDSSSTYIPPEKLPHIKAYAGEDRTVTVGASAEFRGQGFGLEDEPLDNARFLWTFGDGASKDGKNITHVYQYFGDYIVVLNISSGEYSASDYVLVKAIPNQVFIFEIKTGTDSFIEFENKSKEEIDISGCQIKYQSQTFIFPQSTRIRSGAFLVIPSSVSGINLFQGKGIVEFLYSGGFKADSFSYNGFLQNGQSFNRANTGSIIGLETPGAKNSTPTPFGVGAPASPAGGPTSPTEASENVGVSEKPLEQKTQDKDNAQTANIITVGDSAGAKSNTKIYLFAVLGLIVFAGGAIFLIRRKRGV